MEVLKKTKEVAHLVSNLPREYSSKPFSFDEKQNKWAIDISHPIYGNVSAFEDGVVVETETGRSTILVAYTIDAFRANYDIIYEDVNEEYRIDAIS